MNMKRTPVSAAILLCIGMALLAHQTFGADEEKNKPKLYTWTDERGHTNITDDIGKVPEKHRGSVSVMEQTPGKGKAGAAPRPPETQPLPSSAPEDEAAVKAEWQDKIRSWEQKLAAAQDRRRRLEDERADLFRAWGSPAMAPIANRQRAEAIDTELQDVQREINEAKNMLDVVIPEEARKAGVPPGWLRK
jgi:hypothetical protein